MYLGDHKRFDANADISWLVVLLASAKPYLVVGFVSKADAAKTLRSVKK